MARGFRRRIPEPARWVLSVTFGGGGGNLALDVRGALTIDATGAKQPVTGVVADAEAGGTGSAGDVTIVARSLKIVDGGEISSGANAGSSGNAGGVTVRVTGAVLITGAAGFFTGIATQANQGSTGNAGAVRVTAGTLVVVDGGVISSGTFGTGHGGIVMVRAGALLLDDAGQISVSSYSGGAAGAVSVEVANNLTIKEGSGIFSSALASGHAGLIEVTAGQISIADGGEIISTTAGTGAGGSIVVTTRGVLLLDGGGVPDTKIAASAIGPLSGAAGSVTVTAGSLTIEGGAEIASTTAGPGAGGDVKVSVSGDIVLTGPRPEITAQSTGRSTGSGNAGMIAISAARLFMNNGARISTEAAAKTANGGNISLSLRDMLYLIDDHRRPVRDSERQRCHRPGGRRSWRQH
jgi:large exoprotein involved in heme utilization and adhesion